MARSITELRTHGITFDAAEAVAIVQQLIRAMQARVGADELQPPYGPPSADNVFLQDDGSVVCRGCGSTPAVSEVGIFLDALTAGSARVPGGLRYTIARALLDVDVPPFDSLADLSRDLERHERGDRAAVVRGVLARASGALVTTLTVVERRRSRAAASTSELRRALRDAEVRLYERQAALAVPIDVTPVQPKGRTLSAAAACLAAGLALIGAGEYMHSRQPVMLVPPAAPPAVRLPAPAEARLEPEPGIIVVHDAPVTSLRAARPEARRVAVVRRTLARPAANTIRSQPASRRGSRSVLDRLRLGWLRGAFSVHSDL